jgi:hypothetical protein
VISKIGGKFPKNYSLVEFSLEKKYFQKFPIFGVEKEGKKKIVGKKKHWFHSTIIL